MCIGDAPVGPCAHQSISDAIASATSLAYERYHRKLLCCNEDIATSA
jgi:hypothetical protein